MTPQQKQLQAQERLDARLEKFELNTAIKVLRTNPKALAVVKRHMELTGMWPSSNSSGSAGKDVTEEEVPVKKPMAIEDNKPEPPSELPADSPRDGTPKKDATVDLQSLPNKPLHRNFRTWGCAPPGSKRLILSYVEPISLGWGQIRQTFSRCQREISNELANELLEFISGISTGSKIGEDRELASHAVAVEALNISLGRPAASLNLANLDWPRDGWWQLVPRSMAWFLKRRNMDKQVALQFQKVYKEADLFIDVNYSLSQATIRSHSDSTLRESCLDIFADKGQEPMQRARLRLYLKRPPPQELASSPPGRSEGRASQMLHRTPSGRGASNNALPTLSPALASEAAAPLADAQDVGGSDLHSTSSAAAAAATGGDDAGDDDNEDTFAPPPARRARQT